MSDFYHSKPVNPNTPEQHYNEHQRTVVPITINLVFRDGMPIVGTTCDGPPDDDDDDDNDPFVNPPEDSGHVDPVVEEHEMQAEIQQMDDERHALAYAMSTCRASDFPQFRRALMGWKRRHGYNGDI